MDDAASHRTGDSRQNKQEPLEISQFKFMLLPALSKAAATVPPPMAAVATVAMPAWVALCGNMAPVVSMAVFFAPYPTIQQVSKQKTVGSLPILPYSSMIMSCLLWGSYGLLRKEPKVWVTNLIGLCFGMFYFLKFAKVAPIKSPTLPGSIKLHVNAILSVFAATIGLIYVSPLKDPAAIIGQAAVVFCIALFGSPLAALKTVLETKSAKSIPLPFTLATIANCLLWSITGFEMNDFNIYFPNLIGLSFGLAQMALKLFFGDGKPYGEGNLQLPM